MPVYTYTCARHGAFDVIRKVADMRQEESCPICSALARKIIVAPLVQDDLGEYACPITGRPVAGRRAHEENLKRHGCRVYEAGETRDFLRDREKQQREHTERTVSRVLEQVVQEIGGIDLS